MLCILMVIDLVMNIFFYPLDILRLWNRATIEQLKGKRFDKQMDGRTDDEIKDEVINRLKQCGCQECLDMLEIIQAARELGAQGVSLQKEVKKEPIATCQDCGAEIYSLEEGCPNCNGSK
jgi:hypothetical protein